MRRFRTIVFLSVFIFASASLSIQAQTDVAASVYGAFNSSSSGVATLQNPSNGTMQSPSNAAGVLLELRHIRNPFVGFEATYSYNRADQKYSNMSTPPTPCPVQGVEPCGPTTTTAVVPANAHEITGDWVASLKFANLRPFALAGGGLLLNVPSSGTVTGTQIVCGTVNPLCQQTTISISTQTQTAGVFVYGAGVDWTVLPHLGLRFQYRGNLYKAPDLAQVFTSTNSFTHNSEPMIGAFFRF